MADKRITVGVIGLGFVGLTLGIAAASKGIDVYGVEVNEHIKDCLKKKKAHFYEPGLDSLIMRCSDKTFHVVEKFPSDVKFDAFIITVGTPLKNGEKEPNFEYIKSALQSSIKDVYDGSQLIILRSTVSVGTTRNIVIPLLSEMSGVEKKDVLAAMCPERTLEGKAVKELTHLPQVISGNNDESLEMAQQIFRKMTPTVVVAKSLEEAELIKLYCNTYRDMTFALGNAFCMAAQEFGVDGISAINHANYGYDRSNIAKPGFVAGPCLEKDAYILINNMPECDSKNFILSARRFNESMEDIVVNWVREKTGEQEENKTIALSGMAFKGEPETSDLRGSSSVYIARKLKALGYTLRLHDFVAIKSEMEALELGSVHETIEEACEGASILLVLNNHKKYGSVMYNENFSYENRGLRILDSWNVCTELHYSDDIKIYTLGNMLVKGED
ncbi:MAG: nucleotide sugar dehydrogenase [Butyrivibrio sp.]|nr:nucleotide sugar dehydrogenase [Butyrivibrio sp.]